MPSRNGKEKIQNFLQKEENTVVIFVTVQGGREVTVHPENTHLRLNISLQCTAQHAVQCKMVGWQQCAR